MKFVGVQATREDIRPTIVAVDRGRGPIGDRAAERDDDLGDDDHGIVRHLHVDLVEEVPGRGRERERRLGGLRALGAGARRRQV